MWPDNKNNFKGSRSMPRIATLTRAIARQVYFNCGSIHTSDKMIPIFYYSLPSPNSIGASSILDFSLGYLDFYYSAWLWDDYQARGYQPLGIAFGLGSDNRDLGDPFYACTIVQDGYASQWLTFDETCDNYAQVNGTTPIMLGYAHKSGLTYYTPLYRYVQIAEPSPHLYLAMNQIVPGYTNEGIVAFVSSPYDV